MGRDRPRVEDDAIDRAIAAMARHRSPQRDPAAEAAALLRRLGFAILMVLLPVVALLTRRGVVVLAPIGIALLVIAAVIDGEQRRIGASLGGLFTRVAGVAGLVALGWAALSLAWTPFVGPAAERIGNLAATLVVGLLGYLALPERMRSANLYPLAVGVGAAAILAVALALESAGVVDDAAVALDRGIVALALLVWPAAAWMHSRGRDVQAVALVLATAIATGLAPSALAFTGFAAGALVYLVAASRPDTAARVLAWGGAGLILAAPAIAVLAGPFEGRAPGGLLSGFEAWRGMILADPLRLVTGLGFETSLRGRAVGLVAPGAPATSLFQIWIDLGLVGAAALALTFWGAVSGAARIHAAVAPGALSALGAGYAMVVAGAGYTQMWFVTSAVMAALLFAAVERGQFRTKRPKALLGAILPPRSRGKPAVADVDEER